MNLIETLNLSVLRGDFVLASGERSPYKIDVELALHSRDRYLPILEALRSIAPVCDEVAGEGGAYRLAELYGEEFGMRHHKINKSGMMHTVPRRGARTLLLEDVITTGGSVERAARGVEREGSFPHIVAVIVRGTPSLTRPYLYALHERELPSVRAILDDGVRV